MSWEGGEEMQVVIRMRLHSQPDPGRGAAVASSVAVDRDGLVKRTHHAWTRTAHAKFHRLSMSLVSQEAVSTESISSRVDLQGGKNVVGGKMLGAFGLFGSASWTRVRACSSLS